MNEKKLVGRPKKLDEDKAQRLQLRIKPNLLAHLKTKKNVSKYICCLIENDMKAAV